MQLAGLFRNRITIGTWPVGSTIPTVEELMVSNGVSRTTVLNALRALKEDKLLVTNKRRGTQVIAAPYQAVSFLLPATWKELVEFGRHIKLKTLSNQAVPPPVLPHDVRPPGTFAATYQLIRRVHTYVGAKFSYSELYADSATYNELAGALKTRTLAEALGDDPSRIATARQHLSVVPADEVVSEHLGVPIGSSLLQAVRWAANAEGLIVYWAKVSFISRYVHIEMDLM